MSTRNVCGWRALCNDCEWGTRTSADGSAGRLLAETAGDAHTAENPAHTVTLFGFHWTNGKGDWVPEPSLRRKEVA